MSKREITIPDYTRGEEIFNMVSHIVGGATGIVALSLCVIFAAIHGDPYGVVGSAIYGASMIILYTMSSVYHGLNAKSRAKKVFRIMDHCSIFLLIAGTYTPIVLTALREYSTALGWTYFGIVWGLAIFGITMTALNVKGAKIISGICYIVMGWCIVTAWKPTVIALGTGGITFLLLGGISYTVGAGIYYFLKKRRYSHSIFHLFVVAGSILQMFAILFYVI